MTTPDAEDERLVDAYHDAANAWSFAEITDEQLQGARAALLAHLARQRAEIATLRASLEASNRKAEGLRELLADALDFCTGDIAANLRKRIAALASTGDAGREQT